MRTTTLCVVSFLLLLSAQECEFWRRRRRRRRPPPCSARDCVVTQWSGWSACSHRCGNSGTQKRTRTQSSAAACGGKCPYVFDETRGCNRNACPNGGTPQNGYCSCRTGYRGTCCELGELLLLLFLRRFMVKRSVHCSTFDPITVLENYINTYCQMRRMHFGEDIHVVKKNFSFFFSIFLSFFFAFSFFFHFFLNLFIYFFIGGHFWHPKLFGLG